ncbi:hypothetical protein C8R44DRAFT_876524 [Mycena epipterygia]|nr:hypothetical protein C8R44DRAFT_876524 [Mycena epipterygia]
MGLIWLKHPVLWHSSRVPSGYNYDAMTDEQKLLIITRWHNWYSPDWDYGQTTLAFFSAAILASTITHRFAYSAKGPSVINKATATIRYTGARQFHLRPAN